MHGWPSVNKLMEKGGPMEVEIKYLQEEDNNNKYFYIVGLKFASITIMSLK